MGRSASSYMDMFGPFTRAALPGSNRHEIFSEFSKPVSGASSLGWFATSSMGPASEEFPTSSVTRLLACAPDACRGADCCLAGSTGVEAITAFCVGVPASAARDEPCSGCERVECAHHPATTPRPPTSARLRTGGRMCSQSSARHEPGRSRVYIGGWLPPAMWNSRSSRFITTPRLRAWTSTPRCPRCLRTCAFVWCWQGPRRTPARGFRARWPACGDTRSGCTASPWLIAGVARAQAVRDRLGHSIASSAPTSSASD